MKLFYLFPLFFVVLSFGKEVQVVDSDLPKPSYSRILERSDTVSHQLKVLKDRGELTKFYETASQLLKQFNGDWEKMEELPLEKKQDILWCCYLIANTPLLRLDSESIYWWTEETRNLDYTMKEEIAGVMGSRHSHMFFPDDQGALGLRMAYYACVMREFRERREEEKLGPGPKELIKKVEEDYAQKMKHISIKDPVLLPVPEGEHPMRNKENQKRMIEWQKEAYSVCEKLENEYHMKRNVILQRSSRNERAARFITRMEADFVGALVVFFQGNKKAVEKYIIQAGFHPDEMDELIDRTWGRKPSTEFLYKGDRGRRHDRKIKESLSKQKR